MKLNSFDILEKLKFGGAASKAELDYLIAEMNEPSKEEEFDCTIRAFGLGFPPSEQNIQMVERYFKSDISDIALSAIIKTLCDNSFWGLAKNYIKDLLTYIDKDKAYNFSETQIVIFSVLGEYLYETKDKKVFAHLLKMFDEELKYYINNSQDYFYGSRLEKIYHSLDTGIRGREAILDHRVGKMEFPRDIKKKNVLDTIRQMI